MRRFYAIKNYVRMPRKDWTLFIFGEFGGKFLDSSQGCMLGQNISARVRRQCPQLLKKITCYSNMSERLEEPYLGAAFVKKRALCGNDLFDDKIVILQINTQFRFRSNLTKV